MSSSRSHDGHPGQGNRPRDPGSTGKGSSVQIDDPPDGGTKVADPSDSEQRGGGP